MASFKANINRLAAAVIEDALKEDVSLEDRIAALKAATPIYLGDSRIKAQLKIKGIEDDDNDGAPVADFRAIRERIRKAEG